MPANKKTSTKKIINNNKPLSYKNTEKEFENSIPEVIENEYQDNIESQTNPNEQKNILIIIWVIIFAIALWILLFSQKQVTPWSSHLNDKTEKTDSIQKTDSLVNNNWAVKNGDKIKVDYVWKLEDWSVFDASIEEYAKKSSKYVANSWRKYEPLEFTVWAWQMIKWFDAWVVGMKVWEKKTIKISPADWYWEAKMIQTIPSKFLSDNIEQDVPANSFEDTISETFPIEVLWEKAKNVKIWETVTENWVTWKVKSITSTWVTLEIANPSNPFSWQKIAVWAKVDYQWNTITIKKITPETVTVNILNKQSPFFWKKIIEWLVGKLPTWEEIKIVKIDWENTEVETANTHELAWKTLIFDVEVKDIVK